MKKKLKYISIIIISIIMGSMLGYLAIIEPSSFGKDFMAFYAIVFGIIAVIFIIMSLKHLNLLENVGLFLIALVFNPITLLILVLIGAAGCSKPEQGTVWKVAFIDTYIKSQDYVYNFEGKGCKCGHQPYLFGSTFYKEPLGMDSLSLINKFRQTYDEGYIPYAVYAYCSAEDWNDNPRDIEYYDKRGVAINAVELCYKHGLVDSIGHYN